MNKTLLVGRWTKDIETRTVSGTKGDITNAMATLAVNRDVPADAKIKADFPQIVMWGKLAENVARYSGKGRLVSVEGSLQTRSYEDKDGNRRYVTEIKADKVKFLDSAKKSNDESGDFGDFDAQEIDFGDDDDLPF
jgi:single-strand DNA-binding protein